MKKSEYRAKKQEVIQRFGSKATDTGSPEAQVALITERINQLKSHFATHVKDHHSRTGLLKLVGQRKRLLTYLSRISEPRYLKLIQSLELRK